MFRNLDGTLAGHGEDLQEHRYTWLVSRTLGDVVEVFMLEESPGMAKTDQRTVSNQS
jgi:hypothetical protein